MRTCAVVVSMGCVLLGAWPARAATTCVGAGSSIQAAIDRAADGDTVAVAAGTFVEDLDFGGKAITVVGTGPASIIQGTGNGPVVTFRSGETAETVLDSFTVTGGVATDGGGILIVDASPTIIRNEITANRARVRGSGIFIDGASTPLVANNLLTFNRNAGIGDPHSIQVRNATPAIINNTIVRGDSNGILLSGRSSAATVIMNNIIAYNGSPDRDSQRGRGICDFSGGAVIQHNFFYRNTIAALLTSSGVNFRRVRTAERLIHSSNLAHNNDRNPRFVNDNPRKGALDFTLTMNARARDAGNPDPTFNDRDGTPNDAGFTGGPLAR